MLLCECNITVYWPYFVVHKLNQFQPTYLHIEYQLTCYTIQNSYISWRTMTFVAYFKSSSLHINKQLFEVLFRLCGLVLLHCPPLLLIVFSLAVWVLSMCRLCQGFSSCPAECCSFLGALAVPCKEWYIKQEPVLLSLCYPHSLGQHRCCVCFNGQSQVVCLIDSGSGRSPAQRHIAWVARTWVSFHLVCLVSNTTSRSQPLTST